MLNWSFNYKCLLYLHILPVNYQCRWFAYGTSIFHEQPLLYAISMAFVSTIQDPNIFLILIIDLHKSKIEQTNINVKVCFIQYPIITMEAAIHGTCSQGAPFGLHTKFGSRANFNHSTYSIVSLWPSTFFWSKLVTEHVCFNLGTLSTSTSWLNGNVKCWCGMKKLLVPRIYCRIRQNSVLLNKS